MSEPSKEELALHQDTLNMAFKAIEQGVDFKGVVAVLFSVAWAITEEACGQEEAASVMSRHIALARGLPASH